MPPVDPYAPVVDATAASSPVVGLMDAATVKRQRDLQAWQQEQDLRNAQEARAKQSATLAAAHDTHIATQDQNAGLQRTMAGDMAISHPAYPGVRWDDLDQPTKDSYANRYGVDAMGGARTAWDSGLPQQNRVLRTQLSKLGGEAPPNATDDEVQTQIAGIEQQNQAAKEAAATAKTVAATQKDSDATAARNGVVIDRTKRMVQTNPQVKYYQAANANYDSIEKNVQKPVRTGADDAYLLQAAATMEAPGRSPTGNDVKEFMRANGITGNLDVIADRWNAIINRSPDAQAKAGRILSDQLARQIMAASKNSLDTRRASLTETIAPHVYRLEDIGEDPYRHLPKSLVDDVYGVSQQPQQPPQGQPANLPPAANPQAPQAPAVPPTAIQHLQQHPELAPYFDQKYGRGSSVKYLTQ